MFLRQKTNSGGHMSSDAIPSIISENMAIEGSVKSRADIQVDGKIKGNLNATSLTISGTAVVSGDITAHTIDISGRVEGNIRAKIVHLLAEGRVEGDVVHEELSVEPGAFINGQCRHEKFNAPSDTQTQNAGTTPDTEAEEKKSDRAAPPAPLDKNADGTGDKKQAARATR